MTILLTADCMGGVWTYALDLIRALPQYHFVVATMGELPGDSQCAVLAKLPNATLRASNWKLEWMENPWHDVERAGEWLLRLEQELAPDVVHLNGFSHAIVPFRAPKLVVAHSCVLSWWRAVKGENAPREWDCYREKVGAGLRAADVVVAPTRAILSEMSAIYGDFAPSQVIWNGSPAPTEENQPIEPFILGAGRLWDEAKNAALLAAIAPRINAPIRVAGHANGGQKVSDNLELLGFLDATALHQQMQAAAIWAHPARYEPFGLATLEAAHRDCALVLSDIPTLRELWDDSAVFVAPDDENGWKNALQRLLNSPEERETWAQKAKVRAGKYSLERFGQSYARLYAQLI